MASALIKYIFLNPVLTGGAFFALTRGSPDIQQLLLQPLAYLPAAIRISPETLISSLKVLFALGSVTTVSGILDRFAFNGWTIFTGAKPWEWEKELCVITGGSGGLGAIVTRHLVQKGVTVAIVDVQAPPPSVAASNKVHFFKCDITNSASVKEVADRIKKELGSPSILCNNAGIGKTALITEVTDAHLDKIFKINLISHWYTVREFLPDMIKNKKGHIVSTASMASYTTVAGMVDYCVTKAGALAFTEGLNQELKWRYKAPWVQVTSINPYWVKTPLITEWVEKKLSSIGAPIQDPEVVGARIAKAILSGRGSHVLLPENNPIMLLASMGRGFPHWLHEIANDTQMNTAVH